MSYRLTIVIPTYNEAENLPRLVSALFDLPLEHLKMLVVDDHSPDGTGQIGEDLARAYPGRISVIHRSGKLGYGTACLLGFRQAVAAGAEAVGQMDCDFSHPPDRLVEIERALHSADIALGSRYVPGGSLDHHWPLWRKGLSAWANFYARTILSLPIRDVTGGFRLYKREVLEALPLHRVNSNGYSFQVEMAYLASLHGCKFSEVPIHFADRRWGKSKMSFRVQVEAAFRVWQIWFAYRDLRKS